MFEVGYPKNYFVNLYGWTVWWVRHEKYVEKPDMQKHKENTLNILQRSEEEWTRFISRFYKIDSKGQIATKLEFHEPKL